MTNPYLDPVPSAWARAAGVVLLVAAVALSVILGLGVVAIARGGSGLPVTSSTLIFGLVLLALCGICWQAGYRLLLRRPDRTGTIFSRPAWFVIGSGIVVITTLMAFLIAHGRGLNLLDVQFVLFFGGIGIWCLVLALRRPAGK
jgi:hypothetical protein